MEGLLSTGPTPSSFGIPQDKPKLQGSIDVPPDSDAHVYQLQSIKKNLGSQKSPQEAAKVMKSMTHLLASPSCVV